ncbi:hypothetical protein Y032_0007g3405 [Ancylostoma ceylanicum]|uniref:Uncharacterized protein n=1 Tax=Ancylostoma ceylanicum TaxID=53326 RepID=A0A016VMC3_9BILA|nr:hypothetical protein Y032_0007g3405 [Ancylostoma ceylanicum]
MHCSKLYWATASCPFLFLISPKQCPATVSAICADISRGVAGKSVCIENTPKIYPIIISIISLSHYFGCLTREPPKTSA